jgi:hypothetical protein
VIAQDGQTVEHRLVDASALPGSFVNFRMLFGVLIVLTGAALARFVLAPYWLVLSPGYTSETTYSAVGRYRETPRRWLIPVRWS